jgi:hypothetical protein
MKRMWQNMLAMIAVAFLAGTAVAQDWNQPSAIGSYQSILSRAGYGNAMNGMGQAAQQMMQGAANHGGAMYGMQNVQNAVSGAITGGAVTPGALPAPTISSPPAATAVGSAAVGAPMTGGQIMSTPMPTGSMPLATAPMAVPMGSAPMATGAPMMSSPSMGGAIGAGASCNTCDSASSLYGGILGGSVGVPSYSAAPMYSSPVISAPVYSAPVYQSVVSPVVVGGGQRARSNYSVGLYGMFFQRDYEDQILLASNTAGDKLYTTDADEQNFDGYGVSLASRNSGGGGFEVAYWALNPGRTSAVLTGGNVATAITGLDQLTHVSSGRDLYDIYANTLTQTIIRDTDINNLEFNLLRNGGTFCRNNRRGFYEMFGGFRWFEFNESLQYQASIDTAAFPLVPSDFFYNLQARNRLLGLQLGARNEVCLGSKLRFFSGVRGGIFNNNIRTVQNITDLNGEIAQVNSGTAAGRPFSYNDEKNDVAFLGQLDVGFLYHLSCRTRVRLGYRALGVSGVALAAHQLPFRYNEPEALLRANSNGSLLLNGGYYGLEFCF